MAVVGLVVVVVIVTVVVIVVVAVVGIRVVVVPIIVEIAITSVLDINKSTCFSQALSTSLNALSAVLLIKTLPSLAGCWRRKSQQSP